MGRLVFHVQSGTVVDNEFRPCYRESHQVKEFGSLQPTEEELPFRLTRNLVRYITPFGVNGAFINTIGSAADAVVSRRTFVEQYLRLFMRDDLLSWHSSKTRARSEMQNSLVEKDLRPVADANVREVLWRVDKIA